MNPYEILNISEDASLDEIKRTFYFLAKKYHPDLSIDENDRREKLKKFSLLSWAYNELKGNIPLKMKDVHYKGDREYVRYLYKKVYEFINIDDLESALTTLMLIEKIDIKTEKSEEFHYLLGKVYFKMNELHKALKSFRVILDQNPWHVDAKIKMAQIYEEIGLKKTAIKIYNEILAFDNNNNIAIKRLFDLTKSKRL